MGIIGDQLKGSREMAHGDGKFAIEGGRIVKKSNGEVIPEDEPIMILRARDHLALATLKFYRDLCIADGCTDYQLEGCLNRVEAFNKFAREHPERMKQPGITKGE